jgi:heat shock protein HtpX
VVRTCCTTASRSRGRSRRSAYAKQVPMNVNPAQATAYIINPFTGRKAQFMNLTSSHPPTADRIARLRSGQY